MQSSRLLSILLRLQLRERVSAAELARAFEVSVRTIYRDVDALSAAGVPVYAERGRGGGIGLMAGWRQPLSGLQGLTGPEARGLPLAGLHGAAQALGLGPEAADVQLKLLASLPPELAVDAARMSERVHIDPLPWYHRPESLPLLPAVAAAVWQGQRIHVRYEGWSGVTERILSPLGLVLKAGLWYLVATVAHGRRGQAAGEGRTSPGPRTFRVSGIRQVRSLPQRVHRPAGFVLSAHWPEAVERFEAGLMVGQATVRLSPQALRLLCDERPRVAESALRTQRPVSAAGREGWVEADVPIESEAAAAQQLLRLGRGVEVVAPASLRAALVAEAQGVLRQHRGGDQRRRKGDAATGQR